MDNIKFTLLSALVMLSFLAIGYSAGHRDARRSFKPLVVHDTTYIEKKHAEDAPEPVAETLIKYVPVPVPSKPDTLKKELHDTTTITIIQKDTMWLPITQKYYERLDGRLRVWVSGYQPQLDRWELDERTALVRRRWGFSVGVGTGVIYTPFHKTPIDAGVGVFGGLTYQF